MGGAEGLGRCLKEGGPRILGVRAREGKLAEKLDVTGAAVAPQRGRICQAGHGY